MIKTSSYCFGYLYKRPHHGCRGLNRTSTIPACRECRRFCRDASRHSHSLELGDWKVTTRSHSYQHLFRTTLILPLHFPVNLRRYITCIVLVHRNAHQSRSCLPIEFPYATKSLRLQMISNIQRQIVDRQILLFSELESIQFHVLISTFSILHLDDRVIHLQHFLQPYHFSWPAE